MDINLQGEVISSDRCIIVSEDTRIEEGKEIVTLVFDSVHEEDLTEAELDDLIKGLQLAKKLNFFNLNKGE